MHVGCQCSSIVRNSLHVQVSIKGASPASEGEEWQGHRDGHVHPNHANLNLVLVLARCWARLGEYGCAVAMQVAIDQRNCFVKSVCLQTDSAGSVAVNADSNAIPASMRLTP